MSDYSPQSRERPVRRGEFGQDLVVALDGLIATQLGGTRVVDVGGGRLDERCEGEETRYGTDSRIASMEMANGIWMTQNISRAV